MPFDRLVKAVDLWAGVENDSDVFGQIGNSSYIPQNISWQNDLAINEYDKYISNASLVVSHLGMGTVITCAKLSVPLVAMPRRYDLHEHRNNHQWDSAALFKKHQSVKIVYDNDELIYCLSNSNKIFDGESFDYNNNHSLNIIKKIKDFIEDS